MSQLSSKNLPGGPARISVCWITLLALVSAVLFSGCEQLDKPSTSAYVSEVITPPAKSEFRWSNGKLPRSFDPALAAAPPETDIVRAMYEGLATTDPRTLEAAPASAEKWSTADGGLTWQFQIRKEAVWSNGKPVKAVDFVRSWNRLLSLGEKAAHPELLKNFAKIRSDATQRAEVKPSPTPWDSDEPPPPVQKPTPTPLADESAKTKLEVLDVKAADDRTLVVKLITADPDLPKLIANAMFSPIYGDGSEFTAAQPENAIVVNGPFRLSLISKDAVVLDRSDTYRARDALGIDTIRFIPADTADEALDAYKNGRVDAVTNAEFEPLAVKLLSPYQDFRRVTHGAVNLYEFNPTRSPYNDQRVREALTISIERERLTEGEMEGSTRPAFRYLPIGGKPVKEIVQDAARARELLADAGFPDGQGFPTVKLVVNRNDAQQRIARAVAKMWKQNLGIETEVIVKESAEMAAIRAQGDFDIIRRNVVFQSSDAATNLGAIFAPQAAVLQTGGQEFQASANVNQNRALATEERSPSQALAQQVPVPSEADALYQLTAIPLYFPASYSLVKPYVQGFEPNGLDVFSLKDVRIDVNWQPKRSPSES